MISPPTPLVAAPDRKVIFPDAPLLVVPVENNRDPLIPVVPASADFNNILPLVETTPLPDKSDTEPPV
jgi:hypothetical protein